MASELVQYDNKEILVIDEIPPFNILDYDIYNKKDFKKYTDDIERIVRTSFEYREFTSFLRNYMDMNKCSFFENVNNIDTFKIKIHIHHCPFTLYDIVITVFNKRMFYNEPTDVELVAKEVMYIHYFLMVGLIPLAETVHELVHKQILFIPLDKVMGNYEYFISNYKQFIPDEAIEKIEYMKEQTRIYNESANLEILKQQPLYIEIPHDDYIGTYKIPSMERIIDLMQNRVNELKNNNQKQISYSPMYYDNIEQEQPKLISPVTYYEDFGERNLIKPVVYE